MSLARPPVCDFGAQAPQFSLPGTDGKTYALGLQYQTPSMGCSIKWR